MVLLIFQHQAPISPAVKPEIAPTIESPKKYFI